MQPIAAPLLALAEHAARRLEGEGAQFATTAFRRMLHYRGRIDWESCPLPVRVRAPGFDPASGLFECTFEPDLSAVPELSGHVCVMRLKDGTASQYTVQVVCHGQAAEAAA